MIDSSGVQSASLIKKETDMAGPYSTNTPGGEGRAAERRPQDPMSEQRCTQWGHPLQSRFISPGWPSCVSHQGPAPFEAEEKRFGLPQQLSFIRGPSAVRWILSWTKQLHETDHDIMNNKQAPIRMCIVCRRRLFKNELNRYVCTRTSAGEVTLQPDPEQLLPGRGLYVCSQSECQKRFFTLRGWPKKCRG